MYIYIYYGVYMGSGRGGDADQKKKKCQFRCQFGKEKKTLDASMLKLHVSQFIFPEC